MDKKKAVYNGSFYGHHLVMVTLHCMETIFKLVAAPECLMKSQSERPKINFRRRIRSISNYNRLILGLKIFL